ncbi:MAG: LysR family transcriptional regulator [Pseudomonadota bacterium]
MRNLDVTTLRSFVAVAENGGVTRAAGFLHLTQSAVSMQLKRLEILLGVDLFDRSGRGISLTAQGEQLLVYARRMVALNDEVVTRLTDKAYEGEITLGVPHDIIYPAIPRVLKQFHSAYPRVKVRLISSYTSDLKDQFARGDCEMILTTEATVGADAEQLCEMPLRWMGAPGGTAWRQRPLRIAFSGHCSFRPLAIDRLDAAQVPWELVVDTESDRAIEATVSADMAICAMIEGTEPPQVMLIDHGGALPDLPPQRINFYSAKGLTGEIHDSLADLLRRAFAVSEGVNLRIA